MSRGNIDFIKGQGASRRVAPGADFISGLIFYTSSLPSGFTSLANIKKIYSLIDAENAGILADYSDETKATATYILTNAGTAGDKINFTITEPLGITVDLGTYTKVTADSTVNSLGDSIAAMINAGTKDHGYTCVNTTGSLVIKARAGLGIYLNGTLPLVATISAGAIMAGNFDEVAAIAYYLVTNKGTDADTIKLQVVESVTVTVELGTYTKITGDDTVTKVAAALKLMVNTGTATHHYTSDNTAGNFKLIARPGLGTQLNSGSPLVVTLGGNITPTIAGTITQFSGGSVLNFSGGIASLQAVWHYHISEFFRINPAGQLYLGFFSVPSLYTFEEITLMQTFASGEIRQIGIYKDSEAYDDGDLTAIDGIIKTYNDAKHKPLSALYAADLSATDDITTIADLSDLTANKVSSIIGQDGAGLGALLFYASGKSITQLGTALGMLSLSAVSEDFGQPAKFNISNGIENDVPAFANGQLLTDPVLSDSALDSIDSKRHIWGMKYVGYAGTYFNDNHCACSFTSDYAYINDNRVIDKACRGIYTALIPYLKSKLLKNADGTLATTTIAFLERIALGPLYQMARDQDLGDVAKEDVYIDPTQDVVSTSLLIINVALNENGIARNIQIPINFKSL
jgi:hypothetical protein